MPLEWKSGELAAGLACYRNQEFFETHEHWENVWNRLADPERLFLQALIQVSVAMHHWQRGNRSGTLSLLQRALRKLDRYPERFGGIDVARVREDVRAWLAGMEKQREGALGFPVIEVFED